MNKTPSLLLLFVTLALALTLGGCFNAPPFICTNDAQCNTNPPGICVQYDNRKGYCAVPDTSCPSKYRYHNSAALDLIGTCATLPQFVVTATKAMVAEHELFSLHLVVQDELGQKLPAYHGTPTLSSDWGDVRSFSTPTFVNGVTDVNLWLNRSTNSMNGPAHVLVQDGSASGRSSAITVTAREWTIEDKLSFIPDEQFVEPGKYFSALEKSGAFTLALQIKSTPSSEGLFTATSGVSGGYRVSPQAVLKTSASPWPFGELHAPSLARAGDRLFVSYEAQLDEFSFAWGLLASDDGTTWQPVAKGEVTYPALKGECGFLRHPKLVASSPTDLRLLFIGRATNAETAQCTMTSTDGGKTWSPPTKLLFTGISVVFLSVVYEGTIYKGWDSYGAYATSSDGVHWNFENRGSLTNLSAVAWHEGMRSYYGFSKLNETGSPLQLYKLP